MLCGAYSIANSLVKLATPPSPPYRPAITLGRCSGAVPGRAIRAGSPMTGTLINTMTVIVGSTVGTFLRARFPDRVRQMVMWGVGLVSLVIGLQMSLSTKNILIVLGSLLTGGVIGEILGLEEGLNRVGNAFQIKLSTEKDSTFSKGFVTASLLFCVGPMTILGSIQDG